MLKPYTNNSEKNQLIYFYFLSKVLFPSLDIFLVPLNQTYGNFYISDILINGNHGQHFQEKWKYYSTFVLLVDGMMGRGYLTYWRG